MSTYDIETAIERRRRQWDAYTERQRAKRIKQAAYHLESLIAARKFLAAGGTKPVFVPEDPEELAALLPAPEPAEGPLDEPIVGNKLNRRNRPTNVYALTKREEAHHATA